METKETTEHVVIVGGGLAGALMACYLGRKGARVDVYERRPDPRIAGFAGGRSINLALSTRGIEALREVGLSEQVLHDAVPMPGRMIHGMHGKVTFQPYSKDPNDAIHSVSRGGLNMTLLDAACGYAGVTLHFGMRCTDVDLDAPRVHFVDESGGEEQTVEPDYVIGADGAFSQVRDAMLHRTRNFSYSQSFLAHGYKELSIPPQGEVASSGARAGTAHNARGAGIDRSCFRMTPHALHIWPRGRSMMIALPNNDGSFTCTLFWPFEGSHGFGAITSRDQIRPFFERNYPDAVALMPTLEEDFERNPASSLVTIRCHPWNHGDKVLLIGDAAHAIVPFYGQGMNAAFEDCRLLDEALRAHPDDRLDAFESFVRSRKDDADAIADMALANFLEMRDKTASNAFLIRKKLEQTLHRWLPHWFTPLYNMVSFTNIPYARARARAARQARALRRIGWTGVVIIVVVLYTLVVSALC